MKIILPQILALLLLPPALGAVSKPPSQKKPTKTVLAAEAPAKPVPVAVSELQIRDGVQKGKAALLSDILRSELLATERFEVMNREDMDSVLKELKFQQSGACDASSCLVEMGQALGVRKMIGGSVGKLGEKYAISVKLVDLKTQKNEKSFTEYYQGAEENLDQVMSYVAKKLAGLALAPMAVKAGIQRRPVAQAPVGQGPKKSALLAAGLSLAVPGVGQLYNGQNTAKASIMLGLGAGAQVAWIVYLGKGNTAQDEYNTFSAVPITGLVAHPGTELTEFDFWADKYGSAKTGMTIMFATRAAVSVYSALDAFLFAKKYRRGEASASAGPSLNVAALPGGARLTWEIPL